MLISKCHSFTSFGHVRKQNQLIVGWRVFSFNFRLVVATILHYRIVLCIFECLPIHILTFICSIQLVYILHLYIPWISPMNQNQLFSHQIWTTFSAHRRLKKWKSWRNVGSCILAAAVKWWLQWASCKLSKSYLLPWLVLKMKDNVIPCFSLNPKVFLNQIYAFKTYRSNLPWTSKIWCHLR